MAYGAHTDEKDVPMMVAKDNSIACRSRISLRGPIKIELEEALWGRRPKGGTVGGMGRERRGYNWKGRGWSLELEDGKFVWVAIIVFTGPWLKREGLQDVTISLMPTMLPREG